MSLPVFSKCCFCIPLRPGLLVLAYLRMIIAISTLLAVLVAVRGPFGERELWILLGLLALLVANLVFSIIFVVGIHKKDYRLLRVYLSFSIIFAAIAILLFLWTLGLKAYISIHYGAVAVFADDIVSNVSSVVDILLQLYFIAVVRSEILKLKAEEKIHYTTSNGEARVVLDLPVVKEWDGKCDVLYSNSESKEVILKRPLFPVDELKMLQLDMEVKKV